MKIAIGSDHGGYALKEDLKGYLANKGYDVVDVYDGVGFNAVLFLNSLQCGLAVFEFFLAVHRNQETDNVGVFDLRKSLHGLVHRGASRNHVFDNHDIGLFGVLVADEHAAFAVVLGFFAVIGKREVLGVNVRELHGSGSAKGNSLVGGAI